MQDLKVPPGNQLEALKRGRIGQHSIRINDRWRICFKVARDLHVPPGRISEIVNGKRSITTDTALRLGRYFGVSPEIWLNLQADYELRVVMRDTGKEIESHVRRLKVAS